MLKNSKQRPRFEGWPVNRVSSAAWPLNARRVVATGKAAQRRRDWIMQGRWWVILADVLPMRILLVSSTLLVVISSLFVAWLGLHFWFLLLLPLLFFCLLLLFPLFLAGRMPSETIPSSLPTFAQEFRSSAGLLSLYAQELKSNPGFLQELRSNPGYWQELRSSPGFVQELKSNPGFVQELRSNPGFVQELKSNPGFLQELKSNSGLLSPQSPATPMPDDPPLVRVLETYDLREVQARRLLGGTVGAETGAQRVVRASEKALWLRPSAIEQMTSSRSVCDVSDMTLVPTDECACDDDASQAFVPTSKLACEECSDSAADETCYGG